jgi:hypothetical protein
MSYTTVTVTEHTLQGLREATLKAEPLDPLDAADAQMLADAHRDMHPVFPFTPAEKAGLLAVHGSTLETRLRYGMIARRF